MSLITHQKGMISFLVLWSGDRLWQQQSTYWPKRNWC